MDNDFRRAWDSLGEKDGLDGRCTYLFAFLAMLGLEVSSRWCAQVGGSSLKDLANELASVEPLYFTRMNDVLRGSRDVALPTLGNGLLDLLDWIFECIRNGQAHQYQQRLIVCKYDSTNFRITLFGPHTSRRMPSSTSDRRQHLHWRDSKGLVNLAFHPEVFWTDLSAAMGNLALPDKDFDLFVKVRSMKSSKIKAALASHPKAPGPFLPGP